MDLPRALSGSAVAGGRVFVDFGRGATLLRDARHVRLTVEAAFTPRGQRAVRATRTIDLGR